uniref:Uncharacterized protein n=1 Tax=Arundo donax TaxID=35708 RepID=A0A0A9FNY8_ARUDO
MTCRKNTEKEMQYGCTSTAHEQESAFSGT